MTQLLRKRFEELDVQATEVAKTTAQSRDLNGGIDRNVDEAMFLSWRVKVRSLLRTSCGSESDHYATFLEAENYQSWSGNQLVFRQCKAVFDAAREDFEGGYLTSVRSLVQAEVFDTELEQAKELLSAGYFPAAAVIAGVVLETTLRQLCTNHGIPFGKLDKMNADLAKAGQYNTLVQKRITALAAIRNSAAHGDTMAFNDADVKTMIEEIERLVSQWLS